MKNLVAKLKETNYKQLLIQHGEKGVFGLVGLFVLICFAGTSWSRYDKQPEEFQKKVDAGTAAINASAWTPERQKEFQSSRDILAAVDQLHSPVDPSRFQYSTNWFWPMYPQQDPVKEPKWFPVSDLLVDSGKFIMIELPEQPQDLMLARTDGTGAGAAKLPADDNGDNAPIRPNTQIGGDVTPRNPVPTTPGPGFNKGGSNPGRNPLNDLNQIPESADGYPPGMGYAALPKSRGVRFVSVRGLFPLRDQIDELVKTMHESLNGAAEKVQFVNFEVERQVAQPGNKPWSGKWEPANVQVSLDLLGKVDFDTELIDAAYTDAVFTMPLPRRVAGSWSRFVGHPKIKELDEKMRELQVQFNEKLIAAEDQFKKEDKTRKRGFTGVQHDVRGLRSSASGAQMQGMMREMQQQVGEGAIRPYNPAFASADAMAQMGGVMPAYMNQVQNNTGRMSQYLLFRYLDFDVTPGNAYRYRVRLELLNPNYKRPVEELIDESIAAGEVRMTPWSEPTAAVSLPEEEKVFLAKIDRPRPEASVLPSGYFDIFQWFSESGTTIAAKLEKIQLGQFVGGPTRTEVLRPAVESFREESIPIFTGAVLADIAAAPVAEIDPNEHSDLKVDAKRLKNVGLTDKALLVDRYGQVLTLDPKATADERDSAQRSLESQNKPWEFLKQRAEMANTAAASDLDKMTRRLRGGAGGEGAGAADAGGLGAEMGGQMNPQKKGKGKVSAGKKAPARPMNSGG